MAVPTLLVLLRLQYSHSCKNGSTKPQDPAITQPAVFSANAPPQHESILFWVSRRRQLASRTRPVCRRLVLVVKCLHMHLVPLALARIPADGLEQRICDACRRHALR